MGGRPKKNTAQFVRESQAIHGIKYGYNKVAYHRIGSKVVITCPVHGDFEQTPRGHLQGKGCAQCAGVSKKSTTDFVTTANAVHNKAYDYKRVDYKSNRTKVEIVCPVHGSFFMAPSKHLAGQGCPKCGWEESSRKQSTSLASFIDRVRSMHGNVFSFDKTVYVNARTKVIVTCLEHGDFQTLPDSLLHNHGCPKCAKKTVAAKLKYSTDDFVAKARGVHGEKYDYSRTTYEYSHLKVTVTCPVHGDFEQAAASHLQGVGCPHCVLSVGEEAVAKVLADLGVAYKRQHTFTDLRSKRGTYRFDFGVLLPHQVGIIEYHGKQHYIPQDYFGGQDAMEAQQARDAAKRQYCTDNGIPLMEIPYWDFDRIPELVINFGTEGCLNCSYRLQPLWLSGAAPHLIHVHAFNQLRRFMWESYH